MDENSNSPSPPALDTGKWIAKIIVAVILAEAIWGFLVSLTTSLILPALARIMGGDPQSPLSLGKGDFNIPAIFASILELCLAGIAAVVLNQWSRSAPARVRVKAVKTVAPAARTLTPSISPTGMPSILPTALLSNVAAAPAPAPTITPQPKPSVSAPVVTASIAVPQPASATPIMRTASSTASAVSPSAQSKPQIPQPAPSKPAAAKPEKPQKPKEVYYNIVGEPINPTEDDE